MKNQAAPVDCIGAAFSSAPRHNKVADKVVFEYMKAIKKDKIEGAGPVEN